MPEPVTIAVINFNGGKLLLDTVLSLKKLAYGDFSLMVVDNGSSDGSADAVEKACPDVTIIRMPDNKGPSRARNVALKESKTSLVFLCDNDISPNPDTLSLLVSELRKSSSRALASPRVLYSDGQTIQSDGVDVHYLAMSMPANRRLNISAVKDTQPKIHSCATGGMILVDKNKVDASSYFDEDYFFGWDDLEFSYRVSMSGYASVAVPEAVIYHHEKVWGTKRSFFQLRNRWYFLLINYSAKTLFLILPVLAVYELTLMVFMLLKMEPGTYIRAMYAVLHDLPVLLRKRRIIQSRRVRADADLLQTGDIYIEKGLLTSPLVMRAARLVNGCFNLYWKAVRNLL